MASGAVGADAQAKQVITAAHASDAKTIMVGSFMIGLSAQDAGVCGDTWNFHGLRVIDLRRSEVCDVAARESGRNDERRGQWRGRAGTRVFVRDAEDQNAEARRERLAQLRRVDSVADVADYSRDHGDAREPKLSACQQGEEKRFH